MTVAELLEQAKNLSIGERKQLAKLLIDTLAMPDMPGAAQPGEHWGQNLLRLLDELGPMELIHPEIEDPVHWVKQIRQEQLQKQPLHP